MADISDGETWSTSIARTDTPSTLSIDLLVAPATQETGPQRAPRSLCSQSLPTHVELVHWSAVTSASDATSSGHVAVKNWIRPASRCSSVSVDHLSAAP